MSNLGQPCTAFDLNCDFLCKAGLTLEGLPLCCPLCSVWVWCEDAGEGRTILVNENGAPYADTCGFERKRTNAEGEEEEGDETK